MRYPSPVIPDTVQENVKLHHEPVYMLGTSGQHAIHSQGDTGLCGGQQIWQCKYLAPAQEAIWTMSGLSWGVLPDDHLAVTCRYDNSGLEVCSLF